MSYQGLLSKSLDPYGLIAAVVLLSLWTSSLFLLLTWDLNYLNPLTYLFIYIQGHLYTGLFITAHDAMHGTVSRNKGLNRFVGRLMCTLFAFNSYDRLLVKHHQHHRHVASDHDPDYHESGDFWLWYWSFIKRYITLKQLILMALCLQGLVLFFSLENLLLFWILPSILSTFQLFYFGTYLPHRHGHDNSNKHHSRSLEKNHIWAFFSCYFFGYHFEHHDAPSIPWWRLWQTKESINRPILLKN